MPGAVFGDFLAAASEQLEGAVTVREEEEEVTRPSAVAEELSRLVAVMSRYCDDLAPCDEVEASGRNDLHPWERAAVDVAAALRIAAGCVHRAADEAVADQVSGTVPQRARHLAAAAAELAAGRDLLHTHLATDRDGLTRARSEWASAVTSVSVTRALVHEIARLSLRLAPFTAWLAACAAAQRRPGRRARPDRPPARTAGWPGPARELTRASTAQLLVGGRAGLRWAAPHGIRVTGTRFLTDVRYDADRVLNIAVHELLHPPWPQGHPVKDSLDALAADPFLAARFAGRDPDAGTTPGPATPRNTRPRRSTSSSIPAWDATPGETR